MCAVLVLIIAAVGIYAVTASSVVRRRRELAIRVAVGAERLDVFSMILRSAALLFLVGFSVGIPLAYVAARSVESMLFGVRPADPAAIGVRAGLLLSAMLIAASIPASRAARVSATEILRHD